MKKKIAVVGTGISGMSIAYFLANDYDVEVYESGNYIGGHSNTVFVSEDGSSIPIDTGFIVYNHVTYPNLCKLFEKLNVPTKKSDMSFSVQSEARGLEFCGSGLTGLFAQKRNFFNPAYIRFLLEINRFNKESVKILDDPKYDDYTLGRYMEENRFNKRMLDDYLIPMSSAVWSTPPDIMLDFPAKTLVRFFYNHGFLGLNTQHQWYTVDGGSIEYVKRITEKYKDRIFLNSPVIGVTSHGKHVELEIQGKGKKTFDKVILASHGDTSLKLLKNPTQLQKDVLSEFQFQPNSATLHTWEGDMPRKRHAWSSWNYKYAKNHSPRENHNPVPFTIYWMNQLQNVSEKKNYFVTINDPGRIPKAHIIQRIEYDHPLFSVGSVQAQRRFEELNQETNVHFVGAYFRYGFHEDGIDSSVRLYNLLEGKSPWEK